MVIGYLWYVTPVWTTIDQSGVFNPFVTNLSRNLHRNSAITCNFIRSLNSNTASICKIHRKIYARSYPTVIVLPDGSSYNIRYHEPRKIITLPLDLSTLTEDERKLRLEKRRPREKIKIEEEMEDNYDANKYLNLIKK